MNNIDYRNLQIKNKIEELKANGVKMVEWKIPKDQVDYIKKFYRLEPALYYIHTKVFSKDLCKEYPILKQITHEKKYYHHDYIITPLKKSQKKVLDKFQIPYSVWKYRIYLV